MLKLFSPFLGLIFFLTFLSPEQGCKKDNLSKSRTDLLTGKTWIYVEYFFNHNGTTGTLAYVRGGGQNLIDLDPNRVKFYDDGSYEEIDENRRHYNGNWKFINNETGTEVNNSTGTYISEIIMLTETEFVWHDRTSGRYGKMIKQ